MDPTVLASIIDRSCCGGGLPLAFLLALCHSPEFYSASRWCGPPHLSSSQLLPVWAEVKGQLSYALATRPSRTCRWNGLFPLSIRHCSNQKWRMQLFILCHLAFYLECASATSRGAEHVAFLPHALDVSYAIGDHGQIHSSWARWSGLLVLSLCRQTRVNSRWWLM